MTTEFFTFLSLSAELGCVCRNLICYMHKDTAVDMSQCAECSYSSSPICSFNLLFSTPFLLNKETKLHNTMSMSLVVARWLEAPPSTFRCTYKEHL